MHEFHTIYTNSPKRKEIQKLHTLRDVELLRNILFIGVNHMGNTVVHGLALAN